MAQKESNATHWVLGGALLLIGLFVIIALVMIRSQAQDITVSVSNTAPSISGGTAKLCAGATAGNNAAISGCSDLTSVTLTAGTTTDVSYFVQVSDTNGIADVDATGDGVFYHDVDATDETCTADNNNCYKETDTCTKITPVINSTTAWFRCDYSLEYYAEPTDGAGGSPEYVGYFFVEDAADASANDSTYRTEVAELVAGTFPTVNFGTLALGFTSTAANNQDVTHTNNGNVVLDIQVDLDDTDTNAAVDCTTGTIPVGNFEFGADNAQGGDGDQDYANASNTDLTVVAQDMDIDIAQRTNDSSAQGPNNPFVSGDDVAYSYWNIEVPANGVLGTCTEELDVTFKEAP